MVPDPVAPVWPGGLTMDMIRSFDRASRRPELPIDSRGHRPPPADSVVGVRHRVMTALHVAGVDLAASCHALSWR